MDSMSSFTKGCISAYMGSLSQWYDITTCRVLLITRGLQEQLQVQLEMLGVQIYLFKYHLEVALVQRH